MSLEVRSPAFEAGDTMPTKYTCDGENVSPPLEWLDVPTETESLVLICDDPDAPRGTFTHWVLYNIPAHRQELPENVPGADELSWGAIQGRNDFGNIRYEGPCPPPGPAHRYYFRLYALNQTLNLQAGAYRKQVLEALQDHVLESTELMVNYSRS